MILTTALPIPQVFGLMWMIWLDSILEVCNPLYSAFHETAHKQEGEL